MNRKRLERIWRQEALKVPQKQMKRRRLWLNDGSCLRLRPQYKDPVWSYDFSDLFGERGTPAYIRSDNGPEFTAAAVRKWLGQVGAGTLFIEPGSPWENGYVGSFNGKFRAELLHRELFDMLLEAQVLVERWRYEYNTFRPHSALGYRPPAPEAMEPKTVLGLR